MIAVIMKGILFAALLIYAAAADIKRREIDDFVPVSILIIGYIGTGGSFWGMITAALPFFIPALVKNNIGGGDVKLMFACGAVLGVWGGIAQIIIGLFLAGLYGCIILAAKGYAAYKKTAIPLAPFLCAGGIASYIIKNSGGFII